MESNQRGQLVFLLILATVCSVLLLVTAVLQGDSVEWALIISNGMYVAALVAGAFGPTEYWAWPMVAVTQKEASPSAVLERVLRFYGLLSVGFGCGALVTSLVL